MLCDILVKEARGLQSNCNKEHRRLHHVAGTASHTPILGGLPTFFAVRASDAVHLVLGMRLTVINISWRSEMSSIVPKLGILENPRIMLRIFELLMPPPNIVVPDHIQQLSITHHTLHYPGLKLTLHSPT